MVYNIEYNKYKYRKRGLNNLLFFIYALKLKHHNLLSTTNCKKKSKTQNTQHAVQSPSAYPVELVNKNMTEAQPGFRKLRY